MNGDIHQEWWIWQSTLVNFNNSISVEQILRLANTVILLCHPEREERAEGSKENLKNLIIKTFLDPSTALRCDRDDKKV